MPRNRGSPYSPSQTTKAFFRYYANTSRSTAGTTITRLNLTATNLGTRVADMAVTFEYFRIVKLRAYTFTDSVAVQSGTSAGAVHAVAYVNTPTTESSAPASIAFMAQCEYFSFANSSEKASIRIPKSAMVPQSPEKWFATYATGTPTEAQSPGQILYLIALGAAVTNSVALEVIIEGEIEFAVPNEPTLTRQRMRDLDLNRIPYGPVVIRDDDQPPETAGKRAAVALR